MAELGLTTEQLVSRWGREEITHDDLGPWFTFAFALDGGTLAALVREVDNAPSPGYILTAIGRQEPRVTLAEFLAESGLDGDRVLREGFE
ncbi:hypothetical protein [Streptomyces mobaraensis]|uniref:Uncharacterized protein n=1 Tax=Streptomyces mobaraensis (strain ATCC 29032 / DSM 40847 / JCM 4168 / NBRC 13819 / NCIMB 11159 / IPCR 16-22) TaxID=1223523 RepID=M3C455_STRM1|nr:hypothetical protein [Streptomyces mobaraensis]EME98745.1 hypothetical protein H340_19823 [Streptomyces mobaraensis NBRC 13819 = DSM 40847]